MVGPAGYPESGRFVLAHEGERVVPRLLVQAVEVQHLLGGELDAAPAVVRRFWAVERSHLKIRARTKVDRSRSRCAIRAPSASARGVWRKWTNGHAGEKAQAAHRRAHFEELLAGP